MFYLALAFFLWLRGFAATIYAPYGMGIRHVLMTATFTHGFMPDTITSIVPGSWSVADEMMFYAIFPLLIIAMNRVRFATAALAIVIDTFVLASVQVAVINAIQRMTDPTQRALMATFTDLWFLQQLPCFLFGMLVFKWVSEGRIIPPRWSAALVLLSIAGMVVSAFYPQLFLRLTMTMRYGVLFALFALGLMNWQPWLLVNPIIGWIGKVSYSGYLIHLALIAVAPIPHANYLEAFFALTAATLFFSSITYFCIEEPGIRLGRRVIKTFSQAQHPTRSDSEMAVTQTCS